MSRSLVFVDLETTGATATADRITEIGIVEVSADGVSEWSSLVNPQTRISDFIVRLTGISNAMVATAPTFAVLAEEVLGRLQGRIFVAHNARFDYGFLRNEFRRAGHDFRATVLCTVRLSRRLYPQYPRHNLDALIERHGLSVSDRHRALGDARLIWQFWQKLQREQPAELLDQTVAALTARPGLPTHLDAALIDDLPEGHGVYLFFAEGDLPLYIGKSKNLRKRVLAHFSADHSSAKEMSLSQQVRRVEWIATGGELGALLKEAALVKKLQPTHNRRLRQNDEFCTWRLQADDNGVSRPQLADLRHVDVGRQDHCFGLFKNRKEAVKVLTAIADKHGLCHALLGLEKVRPGSPCFSRQLERCKGACVGKESIATHNARLLLALASSKLSAWPYAGPIGIREGEDIHVFDGWCHLGTARSEQELWTVRELDRPQFDVDIYKILTKHLRKAKSVIRFGEARRAILQ